MLKNPEKVGDEIIYRYGIVKDATVKVGLRIDEHAPTPYDPTVSVNSVSENGIVNRSDYNYPTDGVLTIPVNTARSVSEDTPDTNITIVSIPEAGTGYTHQYKVVQDMTVKQVQML